MTPGELTRHLRGLRGVAHKLDIRRVGASLGVRLGWGDDGAAVPVGDDCAALPDGDGFLLLAIEGLLDEFVAAEPWFAGYCAVMVNVSDVYAMGGRPLALVDALWSSSPGSADPVWDGMATAARKYGVPVVGGHTNTRSGGDHLAAAVLGRARRLLSSFDARPGDVLVVAIDLRGDWFGPYPYWNASTGAEGPRLRADLEVLPALAEAGLCAAAKDISMGGLAGTVAMLAECSGVGVTIDVSAVPSPPGVAPEKWLACFPSYGFILAVPPGNVAAVCGRFEDRGIAAAAVGRFDETRQVSLTDGRETEVFWDLRCEPFIGMAPPAPRSDPCDGSGP